MILWRLCEDKNGLFEGSCLTDDKYKEVFFLEKSLYEPLTEKDREDMIEVKDPEYCEKRGLYGLWFWSEMEVDLFKQKMYAG